MFEQTLKDVENKYREITGPDMSFEDIIYLKVYVGKRGKNKVIIVFILTDLKRRMKEHMVFVLKAKKPFSDCIPEKNLKKPF